MRCLTNTRPDLMLEKNVCYTLLLALTTLLIACGAEETINEAGNTPASEATQAHQQAVARSLPLKNPASFDHAQRGFITSRPQLEITDANGTLIWSQKQYEFIDGDAPSTVNPSLWRQAKLNNLHGLFKVTDGVYQLRGFDLANMTLIEGKSGWIVVDPLTTPDTARAALGLANETLGARPVSAVLITHSHIDHFGGILGVLTPDQQHDPNFPIYAPSGFLEEATSENIIAGLAMGRRASYMYGRQLPIDSRGHIGSGLGKQPAYGQFGILPPTRIIEAPFEQHEIDGVPVEFQLVSGSEAPAEFTFYLPEQKAFCGAELVSHTLHNLYTLRGAKVRDALKWSNYIDAASRRYSSAEVYFGSHHWPVWGNESVMAFLEQQRDTYKYLHDQTVRLMNVGKTPDEIAEQITLPASLSGNFSTRGYYGSIRHNVRAIYQHYLGWYDANPATLNPLPKTESAARYVSLMGGASQVMEAAKAAADTGDYRWAAELLDKLVFAEPENTEARHRLAVVYDQLGYQAESAPWRDSYLSAAYELRHGAPETGFDIRLMENILMHTPLARFFDSMAVRLNGPEAEDTHLRVRLNFPDQHAVYLLEVKNAVLHHHNLAPDTPETVAIDATLTITKPLFVKLSIGEAGLTDLLLDDTVHLKGSKLAMIRFLTLFDRPDGTFNIVTP